MTNIVLCAQGTNGFTLTMANVEWVCEADGFMSLRQNTDLTVRGPLALDAEPFNYSQCEVTGTDRETYLELQVGLIVFVGVRDMGHV